MLLVLRSFSEGGVPRTGMFYEPFLWDLDVIWQVDLNFDDGVNGK